MTSLAWRPVRGMDFRKLHDARLQAHYAAQWLARAARAHIAPRPDDQHTNLGWDEEFGGLRTHRLPDGSRVGLNIAELSLSVLGDTTQTLMLDGRADPEVRAWLGAQLSARGFDPARLDTLEIPKPPFTKAKGLPRLRAHWARPEIVVQVAFIEWTVHGKLRHPRLLGVRRDKSAREVVRETP